MNNKEKIEAIKVFSKVVKANNTKYGDQVLLQLANEKIRELMNQIKV
jgi:hypothetical protein